MSVSIDRSVTSPVYQNRETTCDEIELQKEISNDLVKSYYVVEKIFDESVFQNIPQWCKHLSPYRQFLYTDNLYHNPCNKIYTLIQFDSEYKIIDLDSYLKKGIPSSSSELNQFVSTLLERFAKELKLVGGHEINVDFYRTKYCERATSMKHFQLGWHFDKFAKSTLSAVFQNDFHYEEGESSGLDIAENKIKGPHNPLGSFGYCPKYNYISCPYVENGAIIFHGKQGEIIHRRSILAKPLLSTATRTVLQIKLKDPNWPEG